MSKKIGFLVAADPDDWKPYTDAFEHELSKNWTIGSGTGAKDVFIDYEPKDAAGAVVGALGDQSTYATVANQFVTSAVDLIVTAGELAADACKTATNPSKPPIPTNPIPVVVASAGDLTKLGSGNLTGYANGQVNTAISDERIKKMNNKWTPIFVMVAGNDDVPPVKTAMDYVLAQLGNKGYRVPLKNNNIDLPNLQATLGSHMKPNGVNVLYVCSDPFVRTNGNTIVRTAHALGMKTMHEFGEWYDKHKGDLCFGPDFKKLFQNAAGYVDRILTTTKGTTLPPVVEAQVKDCVQTP